MTLWESVRQKAEDRPRSRRNIPSLDGLRAISILAVILAHAAWFLPSWLTRNDAFRFGTGNGSHGVAVFFVISEYLITTLLLNEEEKHGSISLRRFYIRRMLRIFPPYYVLLGVMGILWLAGIVQLTRSTYLAALTYSWALYPRESIPLITHSWSLSVEEIFYIIWPLAVQSLQRKDQLMRVTLVAIVLFPLLRVGIYFVLPFWRGHEFYMVHGWGDTMLLGCLLALLRKHPTFERLHGRHFHLWQVLLLVILGFYISPLLVTLLPKRAGGFSAVIINPTILAASVTAVVFYSGDT